MWPGNLDGPAAHTSSMSEPPQTAVQTWLPQTATLSGLSILP